tara:strand:- start:1508 stop:1684 length:177 start_codon:yes stop_codon:yes gene_type:complete
MGENEMYERYIQELVDDVEVLEKKLSLAVQVLMEVRDRDTSPFGKIAGAVLSEIEGQS